jgi:hypothetical protein
MIRSFSWITCFMLAATAVANAQPGGPDGPPPPPDGQPPAPPPQPPPQPPPPAAQPVPVNVEPGVFEDANSGRGWFMPTALSAPAGTFSFSDYELLFVGLGYSITDHFDVSAATMIPIAKGQPFVGLLTAKWQLVKAGNLHVAAHGTFAFSTGGGTDTGGVGTVGGVATLCIDNGACHSHVSGYVGAGFATAGQSSVPILFSGAGVFRLGRHVKLVLEADSGALAGGAYSGFADAILLWYGVRFTSHSIGVDLGLIEPVYNDSQGWHTGTSSDVFPIGVPFLSFTYRS